MALVTITTGITNPSGVSIGTGTLTFTATQTTTTGVLKSTSSMVTPGTNISLEPGSYKVYYTDDLDRYSYVGEIVVPTSASPISLVSLLASS
jgi:hypothetical protein